jgi:hypothetical protein
LAVRWCQQVEPQMQEVFSSLSHSHLSLLGGFAPDAERLILAAGIKGARSIFEAGGMRRMGPALKIQGKGLGGRSLACVKRGRMETRGSVDA